MERKLMSLDNESVKESPFDTTEDNIAESLTVRKICSRELL
jgi:hypothetical protein